MLAVVGFFIWMIAVAVLYLVLGGMGVWDQLNSSFNTLTTDGTSIDSDVIGAGSVFFWSALIGAISAVLITALTTVGAYIYNICADLVGGGDHHRRSRLTRDRALTCRFGNDGIGRVISLLGSRAYSSGG